MSYTDAATVAAASGLQASKVTAWSLTTADTLVDWWTDTVAQNSTVGSAIKAFVATRIAGLLSHWAIKESQHGVAVRKDISGGGGGGSASIMAQFPASLEKELQAILTTWIPLTASAEAGDDFDLVDVRCL